MEYREVVEYQPMYQDGTYGELYKSQDAAINCAKESGKGFWLAVWRKYERATDVKEYSLTYVTDNWVCGNKPMRVTIRFNATPEERDRYVADVRSNGGVRDFHWWENPIREIHDGV